MGRYGGGRGATTKEIFALVLVEDIESTMAALAPRISVMAEVVVTAIDARTKTEIEIETETEA